MGNLVVRAAKAADSPAIVDIHVPARRSYYEGHLPETELLEWEQVVRATGYADRIGRPGRTWLCAEDSGVVVGFALVAGPELLQLQVRPADWRRGVGSALHAACVDIWRAAGVPVAGLDVFEPNTRAQGFYVRHGWREVERGGEPSHVRMALDL
ncbi:GNAT family N-acetyltransferase [Umezawaea endophytica]|uniref:GNAT family N-acetyltransferase n=1 Tax=Umezawaea endophytica TaxID=1654476 RepID=A0A9X2VGN8_9PSEU|nr:GNAT family N-acetyltransferase [Umezawaea endophytica]MCS7476300.1 GNAT family N-acetyltransferase [Umezawaea endophytica]